MNPVAAEAPRAREPRRPAGDAVTRLLTRRAALQADKRQRVALAELCRRKLEAHEAAIAAIDSDVDVIDALLFEMGAAGMVAE